MLNQELEVDKINRCIKQSLPEEQKELVSDGYHTFKELYAHRVKLFVALCNAIYWRNRNYNDQTERESGDNYDEKEFPWKSLKHADGTMYNGMFIAGIGRNKGDTLTYHLPIEEWHNMNVIEYTSAPEWDGHTSDDVLKLLSKI